MNYTLNQLRIFLTVTKSLSITKAADELHLTQPAVSIQLKNFQDQFDIPLIEVINKKIYVTDFGKEIVVAAERILDEVYAINFKMHAFKGELTGKIKFSVVSTGKYIAPYFITDFIQKHSGVELFMDVTNKSQVLKSLENNEVDFSFVTILPESLKIEKEELMTNKLFLVAGKNSIIHENLTNEEVFETIPLIFREKGSGVRHVMESYFQLHNLNVTKKMELTSNEAVKQAVIAGLGYSIMPLIGIKNEIENGQLKVIPVKGFPIQSTWHLIWLQNKKLSPVAASFLNFLRENKDSIISEKFGWIESNEF